MNTSAKRGYEYFRQPKSEMVPMDVFFEQVRNQNKNKTSENKPVTVSRTIKSSNSCPLNLKPFKTHPNLAKSLSEKSRFLIPILKWGPNNQILGFYESYHLAKFLKINLVLPPFYFHRTDNANKLHNLNESYVPGELRVNSQETFLEDILVDLEHFKKYCGSEVTAAFLINEFTASKPLRVNVYDFENITGIRIMNGGIQMDEKIDQYPKISDIHENNKSGQLNDLTYAKSKYKELFNKAIEQDGHKCIAFMFPFHFLIPRVPMDGEFSPVVSNLAEQFIKNVLPDIHGERLIIGVHWRYNEKDWSNRCSANWAKDHNGKVDEICGYMEKLDYEKVAANLYKVGSKFATAVTQPVSNESLSIYIASPPSEEPKIKKIKQAAQEISTNFKIYHGPDLEKFIRSENYDTCDYYKNFQGEVVSLTEQAILTSARKFFYLAQTSSWTWRIMDRRKKLYGSAESESLVGLLGESLIDNVK